MGNSEPIRARVDSDRKAAFDAYCEEHDLTQSTALRIALERLLRSAPKKPERERAALPMGNPDWLKD